MPGTGLTDRVVICNGGFPHEFSECKSKGTANLSNGALQNLTEKAHLAAGMGRVKQLQFKVFFGLKPICLLQKRSIGTATLV